MRVGVHCCLTGEDLTDAEALEHSKRQECELAPEMMAGILDESGRETAFISATMLTGCRRQVRLKMEEDYRVYPQKMFPAWRGTLGHLAMERYPEPGYLYEGRWQIQLPGVSKPFTGQIDKLGIKQKRIIDFKTKQDAKIPSFPEKAHILQLNIYRWLVFNGWPQKPFRMRAGGLMHEFKPGEPAKIEIEHLELVYWSFSKVRKLSVPLMPMEEVESFVKAKLQETLGKETPPVPEELNPLRHPLCTDWCPVQQFCVDRMLNQGR